MTENKPIVASLCGDWPAVLEAVNDAFGHNEFTLLAEDAAAEKRPYFTHGVSLDNKDILPRGRVFDKNREVRWRKIGDGRFVVTYLSETTHLSEPANFTLARGLWTVEKNQRQKLYGKYKPSLNRWIEVAVPGAGEYRSVFKDGCQEDTVLEIRTVDYLNDGVVRMTRYCEVNIYEQKTTQ